MALNQNHHNQPNQLQNKSLNPRIRLVRSIRTIRKQGLKLAKHHGTSKSNSGIHVPKDCNEIAHMLINLRQLSSGTGTRDVNECGHILFPSSIN